MLTVFVALVLVCRSEVDHTACDERSAAVVLKGGQTRSPVECVRESQVLIASGWSRLRADEYVKVGCRPVMVASRTQGD